MNRFRALFSLTFFGLVFLLDTSKGYAKAVEPKTAESFSVRLGDSSRTYTVVGLKEEIGEADIAVVNPAYNKSVVKYRAFDFKKVLEPLLEKIPATERKDYKIVVTCLDGYRPIIDLQILDHGTPYIAFEESALLDESLKSADGHWTQVDMTQGKGQPNYVSPGPFYLVWDNISGYPTGWPFQIKDIALVKKDELEIFKAIAPQGAFDATTYRGYELFLRNCSTCHSINGFGAGMAPDLAAVSSYRDDEFLISTISRGVRNMPAFQEKLSETEIGSIISYLKNIGAAARKD